MHFQKTRFSASWWFVDQCWAAQVWLFCDWRVVSWNWQCRCMSLALLFLHIACVLFKKCQRFSAIHKFKFLCFLFDKIGEMSFKNNYAASITVKAKVISKWQVPVVALKGRGVLCSITIMFLIKNNRCSSKLCIPRKTRKYCTTCKIDGDDIWIIKEKFPEKERETPYRQLRKLREILCRSNL